MIYTICLLMAMLVTLPYEFHILKGDLNYLVDGLSDTEILNRIVVYDILISSIVHVIINVF